MSDLVIFLNRVTTNDARGSQSYSLRVAPGPFCSRQSALRARTRMAGVPVTIGHEAAQVPEGAEVVVSSAISPDNPEVAGRPTLIHGNTQLFYSGMGRLSENSVVSIKNKSFSVTAEVEVPDD